MMKSFVLLASVLAILFNTIQAKQCSATAYYHKKVAYNSGIYFHHGQKYHAGAYGSFWDGVNETTTKNIGLKRNTFGYDKDMVGYIWGNAVEYGYMGSGRGYLLGLQAAVGSLAGLITPEVERAFQASYQGKSEGTWNQTSGFPNLASPAGASTATGIETMMNRTMIEAAMGNVTEANDDDDPIAAAADQTQQAVAPPQPAAPQRRAHVSWANENNRMTQMRRRGNEASHNDDDGDDEDCDEEDDSSAKKTVAAAKQANASDDSEEDDCDDDDDDDEEDGTGFKHPPQECAVYHAPWKTSKPVYFHGQCDNCDQETGFNKNGHGSFQSCTLIYQGKEYKGKPSQTDDMYTCVVDFECA